MVFSVPVFAVQQGDAVPVCPRSRHVCSDGQSLWQLFLAGIFHDQNVITGGRQTPSQLDADLQQKNNGSCYRTQTGQTFSVPVPLSYIIATADRHVGVARGHPLSRAGARQMVVVDAAGVVAGDGGEGVQRQIPVQQTAGDTGRKQQVDGLSV